MWNNYFYNPRLRDYARAHRKNGTRAETRIWSELLRNRQMGGYRFRRQRAIGPFIVDFFCKELMLIIEVDGYTHTFPDVQEYDAARQFALEGVGFRFLRFDDQAVMDRILEVEECIWDYIRAFEAGRR
ncbi:MAG: endonuclease domain-containing protein [Saprospiraceae bacterium]|nr:endonuclease domain-containing protein [Saprospiraceae bacterium]